MSKNFESKEINLASLLPSEIFGWRVEGKDELYDPDTIFDYIDGAGEVYRAYNFKQLLARRYKKQSSPDIIVDLFDMGSSKDAFGVFTHDLEGEDAGIGQGAVYQGGLLSFWKDRFFVSLYAEEEIEEARQALFALGRQIAQAIPEEGAKPSLLSLLPGENFKERDIHYFHNYLILNYHFFISDENILMLNQQTEAVLAISGEKSKRCFLLLAKYPDAKTASQAIKNFTKIYMPDALEPGFVQTEDKKWTAARIKDDLIMIVFNAPSSSKAKEMMDKVEQKMNKS